jgi:hypothetical protein
VFAGLMVTDSSVIPPSISGMTPSGAKAGDTVTATIEGALFEPAAVVTCLSSSISITTYEVVTSGRIAVSFTVSSAASGGVAPFVVTNPNGGYATYNFAVTNADPAFAIVGVFPPMTSFPRDPSQDVTISNFALFVTGVSPDATVSFSDPNVYPSKVDVSTEAQTIFLGTLTIGKATTAGSVKITVTNPDGKTASITITLTDKRNFAEFIGLILPGPSFYRPDDGVTTSAMMNKLPATVQVMMIGPGFTQKTDFTVPAGGGTVFAAGSRPGAVRSLTVQRMAGTQAKLTARLPGFDDRNITNFGLKKLIWRVPETGEMQKKTIVFAQ